jgi:ferritin-like metal-binding protein YciE
MATLRDLFKDQLKDIYDAENQIVAALPKMIDAASHDELKAALTEHLEQTRGQIDRLERVFAQVGASPARKTCKGMKGLLEEGSEAIKDQSAGAARDALIIGGAQKVEHYEIAEYGTLRAWAEELDLGDAAELLGETLDEEADADERLSSIAEGGLLEDGVNEEATAAR